MAILGALYFWIRGWNREQTLFWIFPTLAIGFLFKSVIVLLFVPVVLIYSLFYWRWSWIKSKYLWIGVFASLVILLPWHMLEAMRYGSNFWSNYLGYQVFQRSISTVTGTFSYDDYIKALWTYSPLWLLSLIAATALYLILCFSAKWRLQISWRYIAAPLCTALVILGIFSIAKTHLLPYMLPIFPFVAMFVGILYHRVSLLDKRFNLGAALIMLPFIITGIFYFFSADFSAPMPAVSDEAAVAKIYKNQSGDSIPLYLIGNSDLETLNYYSGTTTIYVDPAANQGKIIRGPFYAVMPEPDVDILFSFYLDANNTHEFRFESKYAGQQLLYVGPTKILIYSAQDFQIPEGQVTVIPVAR